MRNASPDAGFWRLVKKRGLNQCWPWRGFVTDWGTPIFPVHDTSTTAMRLVWESLHGEIPKGIRIFHTCKNPLCCNPKHLLLGTRENRFWAKVRKGTRESCWLWQAAAQPGRYGLFDKTLAHRVSWEITNGPIPPGLYVTHVCDNPKCVNPTHLVLGLPQANTRDMVTKGRQARSDKHGMAKLTTKQARNIRKERSSGHAVSSLAARYGVSKSTIRRVISGESWSDAK